MAAYPAGDDYFHFTSDFVEYLRATHPFDISVGAYPEKHPDVPRAWMPTLSRFKRNAALGLRGPLPNSFFDTKIYSDFLELVTARGIKTPMVPGLLPIGDLVKIQGFAAKCGANIPSHVAERLTQNPHDSAAFLAQQIRDMMELVSRISIFIHSIVLTLFFLRFRNLTPRKRLSYHGTCNKFLGFPRIGAKRELKKAVEMYWQATFCRMICLRLPIICARHIGSCSARQVSPTRHEKRIFHSMIKCWI